MLLDPYVSRDFFSQQASSCFALLLFYCFTIIFIWDI